MHSFAFISRIAWQVVDDSCSDIRIARPWWDNGRLIVCNHALLIAFDMPTPPKFVINREHVQDRVLRPPSIDRFLAYCEGVADVPLPEIAGPSTLIQQDWSRYDSPLEPRLYVQENNELIRFRGVDFAHQFLWILSQLPGLMTLPPVPNELTLPFVFHGGRGCLQPVVDEAEMAAKEAAEIGAVMNQIADSASKAFAAGAIDDNAIAAARSLAEDEAGVSP